MCLEVEANDCKVSVEPDMMLFPGVILITERLAYYCGHNPFAPSPHEGWSWLKTVPRASESIGKGHPALHTDSVCKLWHELQALRSTTYCEVCGV